MNHSIVVTTINPPSISVERMADGALANNWQFVVVGDVHTPDGAFQARRDNLEYISIHAQRSSDWRIASVIPTKTYARKMFGYLQAISSDADYIIDTDDDNWPLEDFFVPRNDFGFANASDDRCISFEACGWVNVYRHFCQAQIWPRGFPLSEIKTPLPLQSLQVRKIDSIIFQGLAEGAPDVDAVHRLVFPHNEYVFNREMPVELRQGAYCPFNSQNTTWAKESFFLLYLPFTCSFRMTDIYRSYIAQRIVYELGKGVLFHHATVHQDRNDHSIIDDFRDEVSCYINDGGFTVGLAGLNLVGKSPSEMLLACYGYAVQEGFVESGEMEGVKAWLSDLEGLGVLQ